MIGPAVAGIKYESVNHQIPFPVVENNFSYKDFNSIEEQMMSEQ